MATYIRRAGITSCDACHEVTGDDWRSFAAHTAAHHKADQRAARQARIDALNRLTTTERQAS